MKSIIDKLVKKLKGNRPATIKLKERSRNNGILSPVPVRIRTGR